MINLLNAGFTRLRKNKAFWLLSIFSIGLACFVLFSQYNQMTKYKDEIDVLSLLLSYATMIGLILSIFTSLFLGAEYSDGALRNKISIGHKRKNIYLSNWIIIVVTSLFSYFLYALTIITIGIPIFGWTAIPLTVLLMKMLVVFMIVIAYASIFTLISMICSNKTITAIIAIMTAFGLMMTGLTCYSILNAPEQIQAASIENGETVIQKIPNPKYPSKEKRDFYQTLLDINPAGQSYQLNVRDKKLEILALYSLGIVAVSITIGLFIFQKKELK